MPNQRTFSDSADNTTLIFADGDFPPPAPTIAPGTLSDASTLFVQPDPAENISVATPAAGSERTWNSGRSTLLPQVVAGPPPILSLHPRDRYATLRPLGEGGMGTVEVALDQDIGREVAIKRLRGRSPAWVGRFVSEIRTNGRLEHPNIVPIHDVGQTADGAYFFVMKYVEGYTLEDLIARLSDSDPAAHAEWPFERRAALIRTIAQALQFAHSRKILHRDIKPANILIGRYGEVFLMDWGIARTIGAAEDLSDEAADRAESLQHHPIGGSTRAGSVIGTPAYMSPEQLNGETTALQARSDVYSLGMVLYELMALKNPWSGTASLPDLKVRREKGFSFGNLFLSTHPAQGSPPAEYLHLVEKMVRNDPEKRMQDATAVMKVIDDILAGRIPVECHITMAKRMTRESGRILDRWPNVTFVLLIVMAVCAVTGFGVLTGLV